VERREARVLPLEGATGVPRFGTQRVPLHPRAVSALRHPSGWMKGSDKPRAQIASREREGVRVERIANGGQGVFLFVIRHSLFAGYPAGYLTL